MTLCDPQTMLVLVDQMEKNPDEESYRVILADALEEYGFTEEAEFLREKPLEGRFVPDIKCFLLALPQFNNLSGYEIPNSLFYYLHSDYEVTAFFDNKSQAMKALHGALRMFIKGFS